MLELLDLFPKTIAVTQLQSVDSAFIDKAIAYIDNCSQTDLKADGSFTDEQQLLNAPLFADVKAEILNLCREFADAYAHEIEDVGICNSWGNVIREGQSIRYHRHDNSYISGSFYLSEGSRFNLLNGLNNELFGIVPKIKPDAQHVRSLESLAVEPKPGRIILFPSGMYHCVLPERGTVARYSVAFNAIPLGQVGKPTSLMDIQIRD